MLHLSDRTIYKKKSVESIISFFAHFSQKQIQQDKNVSSNKWIFISKSKRVSLYIQYPGSVRNITDKRQDY